MGRVRQHIVSVETTSQYLCTVRRLSGLCEDIEQRGIEGESSHLIS